MSIDGRHPICKKNGKKSMAFSHLTPHQEEVEVVVFLFLMDGRYDVFIMLSECYALDTLSICRSSICSVASKWPFV